MKLLFMSRICNWERWLLFCLGIFVFFGVVLFCECLVLNVSVKVEFWFGLFWIDIFLFIRFVSWWEIMRFKLVLLIFFVVDLLVCVNGWNKWLMVGWFILMFVLLIFIWRLMFFNLFFMFLMLMLILFLFVNLIVFEIKFDMYWCMCIGLNCNMVGIVLLMVSEYFNCFFLVFVKNNLCIWLNVWWRFLLIGERLSLLVFIFDRFRMLFKMVMSVLFEFVSVLIIFVFLDVRLCVLRVWVILSMLLSGVWILWLMFVKNLDLRCVDFLVCFLVCFSLSLVCFCLVILVIKLRICVDVLDFEGCIWKCECS